MPPPGSSPPTTAKPASSPAASPARIGAGGLDVLREILAEASPDVAARVDGRDRTVRSAQLQRAAPASSGVPGDRGGRSSVTPATGRTRSASTVSPTPSATPNCSPARIASTEPRRTRPKRDALADYQATRDRLSRQLFDVVDVIAAQRLDRRRDPRPPPPAQRGHGRRGRSPRRPRRRHRAMTGTLLRIWAHPDDEAYLSAGIMADARRRGDRKRAVTPERSSGRTRPFPGAITTPVIDRQGASSSGDGPAPAAARPAPYSAIGTLAGTGLIATSGRPPAVLRSAAPAGRDTEHRTCRVVAKPTGRFAAIADPPTIVAPTPRAPTRRYACAPSENRVVRVLATASMHFDV